MSYVIQAVLSNPRHPECGQITIPFPIPADQYDQTIEMLRAMDLGHSVDRDCAVDDVDSHYSVLSTLNGTLVNVDQLDYLAKRLDSFCEGEDDQFLAMAHKLELTDIRDLINLTFCCQRATVITDFSDLERIGRTHRLNLSGGAMPTEEYAKLNGRAEALRLIAGGGEMVTPYGVVYDNGMRLEPLYDGRHFPSYLYKSPVVALETVSGSDTEGYFCLPMSDQQIQRMIERSELEIQNAPLKIVTDALPEKVAEALDMESLSVGDISALNQMCRAIEPLKDADMEKLSAIVLTAGPGDIMAVCHLAENLDRFDFVPDIHTPEEYGKYMIQQSGRFEYDEELEDFYDYRSYGEQRVKSEDGHFNECGYVAYRGILKIEELMYLQSMEQSRQEQGMQMQ